MSGVKQQLFFKAPFRYNGSKSRAASLIWQLIGPDVDHFIDPMMGSLAVLLARPREHLTLNMLETVNDRDGLLVNFWRAVKSDPEQVAFYVSFPISHIDLVARRMAVKEWVLDDHNLEHMITDETYCDHRIAGYWLYVASLSIGSVQNTLYGPWWRNNHNLVRIGEKRGVKITVPAVVYQDIFRLSARTPQTETIDRVVRWLTYLQQRLRYVRILCDNWSNALRLALMTKRSFNKTLTAGIFLDPPYNPQFIASREVYIHQDTTIYRDVLNWCIENGNNPNYRIVYASYKSEETDVLLQHGWREYTWNAPRGYARSEQAIAIRNLERLYASPHCLHPN